ncbi:1-deoxy-D-xylulose-5-phosphate synthase [Clostridia bacterium]|nr:1-deoxy-D-xylulose-5-phosphate synthase [Clostridia bacterium]GHV32787.1 1-deoxy-D-xylulose-5-phosphate synthase [Clostridia bacterium]
MTATEQCAELRQTIIDRVGKNGGHLSSNLGAVELTVALHRVYDTSRDRLVFDVGHQCYAHKLLTGRDLSTLRRLDGIAGFPKPSESVHDAAVSGHASSSISSAIGMLRAAKLLGEDYAVAAVLGDGSMTGGMAYEALEDAGASGLPLVVVLNDNGMSITRNVGGVARHLAKLREKQNYFRLKDAYRRCMKRIPFGRAIDKSLRGMKMVIKDALFPSSMFESMGFRYLGPTDGHDVETLTRVLRYAKGRKCPMLVHVKTVKGKGCGFAEKNPSRYHGVPGYAADGAMPLPSASYGTVMGETVANLAASDRRIVAVTAAMGEAVGLDPFASMFPDRFFDVGIAEEHAVTMSAGMAKQGLRPLCAIYSTFLQRGFDQLIHDVAIDSLPVVFAVDRAGLVGQDGETHHGLFDAAYLNIVPNMTVFSPSSFAELRECMLKAFALNAPAAVRYPRGGEGAFRDSSLDAVILRGGGDVTLLTYGSMTNNTLKAAELLEREGIAARVVKITRITPLNIGEIAPLITDRLLVAEPVSQNGGVFGRLVSGLMERGTILKRAAGVSAGAGFVTHGRVEELERRLGMDAAGIAGRAKEICGG